MDILFAMAAFVLVMLLCLLGGYPMLAALAAGFVFFILTGMYRGYRLGALLKMAAQGGKRALIVLRIFLLIGIITGLWRASGTVACCIYWGVKAITPHAFLLVAFLLTSLVSFALGTSLGVAGTLGVIFMLLARSGGVNEVVTAGVLLSGVYVGDRGAPSSSCANLVATITGTKIGDNVRLMLKTTLLPYLCTLLFYAFLSVRNPIVAVDSSMLNILTANFHMSPWALLPAVLMLALPLCHVPVMLAMLASILSAGAAAMLLQGMTFGETLLCALKGFSATDPFVARLFNGGGLLSMVTVSCIVILSCTYAGIFEGTHMLDGVQRFAQRGTARIGRFPAMLLSSVGLLMLFCNQTIAVMMNNQLWRDLYREQGAPDAELAMDTENAVVIVAGLIPWCIASSAPLALMGADAASIPYAAYLYLVPLCWLFTKRRYFQIKQEKDEKTAAE